MRRREPEQGASPPPGVVSYLRWCEQNGRRAFGVGVVEQAEALESYRNWQREREAWLRAHPGAQLPYLLEGAPWDESAI